MTDKTYTVAGISTLNGKTKVRFANDVVARTKQLIAAGHEDVNLVELPEALSKADAALYLKDHIDFSEDYEQLAVIDYLVRNKVIESTDTVSELETATDDVVDPSVIPDEIWAQIPKRNDKGHFIKKEVREEMARELMAQS